MNGVAWQGDRPQESLARALQEAGLTCSTGRAVDSEAPVVGFTGSARVPAAPASCPGWIWLCRSPLSPAQRRDAVLRGAYDALSLHDADAASLLAARLSELLVPLPSPPADSTLAI